MSSNYPPGVTGNEYQIVGPDWERDEERACMIRPMTVLSLSSHGLKHLEAAIARLSVDAEYGLNIAQSHLRNVLSDIEKVEMDDGECPFEGVVTVSAYDGEITWECPLCRFTHTDEVAA